MTENEDIDIMNAEEITKKTMVMFYIIDTSTSMGGTKIGTVNTIMDEVIPLIRGSGKADADIKVSVLTFDTDCRWMYDKPISIHDFTWQKLDTGGLTNIGDAFKELNSKLSKDEYMMAAKASWSPVLFLISDGEPTDNYEKYLEQLKKNPWYKIALKVAIAIGEEANKEVLSKFTGNVEAVIQTNNGKALERMIKFVSVRSSQLASEPYQPNKEGQEITPEEADEAKQQQLIEEIKEGIRPEDIQFDKGW